MCLTPLAQPVETEETEPVVVRRSSKRKSVFKEETKKIEGGRKKSRKVSLKPVAQDERSEESMVDSLHVDENGEMEISLNASMNLKELLEEEVPNDLKETNTSTENQLKTDAKEKNKIGSDEKETDAEVEDDEQTETEVEAEKETIYVDDSQICDDAKVVNDEKEKEIIPLQLQKLSRHLTVTAVQEDKSGDALRELSQPSSICCPLPDCGLTKTLRDKTALLSHLAGHHFSSKLLALHPYVRDSDCALCVGEARTKVGWRIGSRPSLTLYFRSSRWREELSCMLSILEPGNAKLCE